MTPLPVAPSAFDVALSQLSAPASSQSAAEVSRAAALAAIGQSHGSGAAALAQLLSDHHAAGQALLRNIAALADGTPNAACTLFHAQSAAESLTLAYSRGASAIYAAAGELAAVPKAARPLLAARVSCDLYADRIAAWPL